jgi:nucleoside phosphorylase
LNDLSADTPIFLHFLNRELRETENVTFSDEQIYTFLIVALLMTNEYIYIGDAIVWECYNVFPKSINLLREMEKLGLACFVGTDTEVNSFLAKRRRLYSHDKRRYPIYFIDNMVEYLWGRHHKKIYHDTTAILARKLFDIVNGFEEKWQGYVFSNRDKDTIAKRLEYRRKNNIAVTYSLFKYARITEQSKLNLRRNIIVNYNQRYLDALNGKLMTGISGLQYYDLPQDSGMFYDYNLHLKLFNKMGIINNKEYFNDKTKYKIFELRSAENKIYQAILLEIKRIACGLQDVEDHIHDSVYFLEKNLVNVDLCTGLKLNEKLFALYKFSNMLCNANRYFKEGYEKMSNTNRKILVLAASPLEYKVLRKVVKEEGIDFEDKPLRKNEDFSYAECYSTLQSKLFLARTDMGALNASTTINQLVEELQTNYVIMGGICAGMRPDKQHIGDVIIATQIHDYDLSKRTQEQRISRGNTVTPNRYLYDKFLLESYENEVVVDSGLFISSNTLANSYDYVKQVLSEYPDAKGYEMEGTGLMYACQLFMDKWILVKSICDWGYDKTDSDQEMAAKNSYSFILNTIKERIG